MTEGEYKILVGMPCLDDIKVETTASLLSTFAQRVIPMQVQFVQNTYIQHARNQLVYGAVNANATHLLFIDSDMAFAPDSIQKLLDRNVDIVGGIYNRRIAPHFPVMKKIQDGKLIDIIKTPEDLFEVDCIGTGFMLIKMSVFKSIDPPFFYHTSFESVGLKKQPFPHNEIGEDIAFCLKAKKAGFKIYCDPTVRVGHVGKSIF